MNSENVEKEPSDESVAFFIRSEKVAGITHFEKE